MTTIETFDRFQLIEVDVTHNNRTFVGRRHIVSEATDDGVKVLCGHYFENSRIRKSTKTRNDHGVCNICHERWKKAKML